MSWSATSARRSAIASRSALSTSSRSVSRGALRHSSGARVPSHIQRMRDIVSSMPCAHQSRASQSVPSPSMQSVAEMPAFTAKSANATPRIVPPASRRVLKSSPSPQATSALTSSCTGTPNSDTPRGNASACGRSTPTTRLSPASVSDLVATESTSARPCATSTDSSSESSATSSPAPETLAGAAGTDAGAMPNARADACAPTSDSSISRVEPMWRNSLSAAVLTRNRVPRIASKCAPSAAPHAAPQASAYAARVAVAGNAMRISR